MRILRLERDDLVTALKARNIDLDMEELHKKYIEEIRSLTEHIQVVQDTNNKFILTLDQQNQELQNEIAKLKELAQQEKTKETTDKPSFFSQSKGRRVIYAG